MAEVVSVATVASVGTVEAESPAGMVVVARLGVAAAGVAAAEDAEAEGMG